MKYYVYQWVRKDTNEPFYVGKGCGNRDKHKKSNKGWKNIVNKVECFVERIKYFDNENDAILFEHNTIQQYKEKGYKLVNQTKYSEGGKSYSYTDEVKEKQSKNRKGKGPKTKSEEYKKLMSSIMKDREISWADKISKSMKEFAPNRTHNPHAKEIIQMDLKGNIIKEYSSAMEAGRQINKNGTAIADCASGRQKTAYGYKWSWKSK